MFHPATVIQAYWATSCRSGLEALNIVNTQIEMPKVTRLTASAVQRKASFLSLGMRNKISTPTNGKKVRRVKGCRKKFMFYPRFYELFQNQITDDQDNTQQYGKRVRTHESILDLAHGPEWIR